MPRAGGPCKVLEKINDYASILELSPDFGVSPTFNISDLRLYLGEEDEMPSRTTPIQEGEDDEDISTTDITIPPILREGPITRSRARQLKQQVNSFLCSSSCENENRLLPNDVLVLRNEGEGHGVLMEHQGCAGEQLGRPHRAGAQAQLDFDSTSESRSRPHQN